MDIQPIESHRVLEVVALYSGDDRPEDDPIYKQQAADALDAIRAQGGEVYA
ncbi:MAG: hypothetical protein HWE20_11890 [Gammaproteobacteria bacterium]|nr:hypothetical protein [Gammaproteobacteria bacterium]